MAARKDNNIIDLRNMLRKFLSNSLLYEPISIYEFLKPISQFLNKEHALMLMKLGKFKDCFNICIDEVKDFQFAQSVARKGFEWEKDRRIYYNLFRKLMATNDPENKKLALQILLQNCQHIPYEKVTKNFDDEDNFNVELGTLF